MNEPRIMGNSWVSLKVTYGLSKGQVFPVKEWLPVDYLALGGETLFAIMFAAGIVPLVMAFRLKIPSLRNLSLLLGLFAVIHGLYHLTFGFQQQFIADVIFEPASLVFLLAFGLYYSKVGIA